MSVLPPDRAVPADAVPPARDGHADRAMLAIARAAETSEGVRRLLAGAPAWAWSGPGRLFRAEAGGRVWTAGVCGDRVVVALREEGARTCAETILPAGWDR